MKKSKTNWMNNPSRKQLILITSLWILANTLLVLSMTNLFTESIFQRTHIMIYLLMFGSTLTTFYSFRNFLKIKKVGFNADKK